MRTWIAILAFVVGCGRIGFGRTDRTAGDDAVADDAIVDDGWFGDAVLACPAIVCAMNDNLCCAGGTSTCIASTDSCAGTAYGCYPGHLCGKFMACCMNQNGSTFCAGTCPAP